MVVCFSEKGVQYLCCDSGGLEAHDEESNRFRPSSLSSKLGVVDRAVQRAPGGDIEKAKASLLSVLGPSAKTRVGKWVRAWKNLHNTIKVALPRPSLCQFLFECLFISSKGRG